MPDADDPVEIEIDEQLMHRLRDAQQAFDEVRDYLEEVKNEVKARYPDNNVVGTFAGEKVFDCTWRETTRINSTRFKREWPDLWRQYASTKRTQYLTVARPKDES